VNFKEPRMSETCSTDASNKSQNIALMEGLINSLVRLTKALEEANEIGQILRGHGRFETVGHE